MIVTDWGGGGTSKFSQAEEAVDTRSNWTGCRELRSEVRDHLTLDGILLVVQGEDDLCGMLKVLGWGVGGDEMAPDEEHKIQEGPELGCPVVVDTIGVFTALETEVEAPLDQIRNVPCFWVGGGGSQGQDGLDDAQGGGFFPLGWGIFDSISFELAGKALVQSNVSLGFGGISGVG